MFQNRHKLQCEDRERHNINNDQEEPKRDIELCLEVEMDDEVREIITCPERCASTLLDVTVIKPKDIDQIYTAHKKTLNGEEVRKLITSMELEKDDQKKLINQILGKDEAVVTIHKHGNFSKSAGDYSKNKHFQTEKKKSPNRPVHCLNSQESTLFYEHLQKISTTDETNSEMSNYNKTTHKNFKSAGDHERVEQIFTTPRTYNDLKALFTCKNKTKYDQNEKPTKPCLCQNCAILGLLNDAQKRPFVTENSYDPREHSSHKRGNSADRPKRKKSVNFKEEIHTECEYYFKYLSAKIKTLEERLALQEEKSVSRDYFKKIITKLVNHISKLTSHATPESRSQKYKEPPPPHKCREKNYDNVGHRYYVHPVLIDQKFNKTPTDKKDGLPNTTGVSSALPNAQCDSFWKWGEEILRPGIDLKNKIIDLLEETLQNLRRPRENHSKADGNIKSFVDEFSTRLYKTINEIPVRDVPSKKRNNQDPSKCSSDPNHSNSGSSLCKKIDSTLKTGDRVKYKKCLPKSLKKDILFEEPLNVSYVNPKINGWHEESQISFKFESSDIESAKPGDDKSLNDSYKQEFMETISNTKETDKLKLWQSIWNQAKTNGQSKQDKVTIQIPNRKDLKKGKMIEIEYTIAELETLLTGKAVAQKGELNNKKSEKK